MLRVMVVLGYGAEGRSTAAFFGADAVSVCDDNPASAARAAADGFRTCRALPPGASLVVRSAGIPLGHPLLEQARWAGVRVTQNSELFLQRFSGRVIGVSGTKGKSTTTSCIAQLFSLLGLPCAAVGNLGRPALDLAGGTSDLAALELSSYMLADLQTLPPVGVLQAVSEEHLDWHGSRGAYLEAKLRLAGCAHVVACRCPLLTEHASRFGARTTWFGDDGTGFHLRDGGIFHRDQFLAANSRLPGRHNLLNLVPAVILALEHGCRPQDVAAAAMLVEPVPGRLEVIRETPGGPWVDDPLATTPGAVVAAMAAFPHVGTLIIGGLDRGLDQGELIERLAGSTIACICLHETGAAIYSRLADRAGLYQAASLGEAVALAKLLGRGCLHAPGAPSYGFYRNWQDRSSAFRAAVAAAFGDASGSVPPRQP